jgi:hypothetical protein
MQIFRLGSMLVCSALLACSAETVPSTPNNESSAQSAAGRSGAAPGASGGPAAQGSAGSLGVGMPNAPAAAGSCPSLRPVEGAACSVDPRVCTYDEIECNCGRGTWDCAEPVDPNCPAMMPAHASPCSAPEATECEFLQDECACMSGLWSCEAFELDDAGVAEQPPPTAADAGAMTTTPPSSPDTCPDLRPVEGFSCEVANVTCRYDTTSCVCPDGSWLCQESVDPTCPIEPPIDGSACMGSSDCDYFDIECECRLDTWNCKAND